MRRRQIRFPSSFVRAIFQNPALLTNHAILFCGWLVDWLVGFPIKLRARDVALTKHVERLEQKIQKLEINKQKQHEKFVELREMFEKQRALARAATEGIRKRDATVSLTGLKCFHHDCIWL